MSKPSWFETAAYARILWDSINEYQKQIKNEEDHYVPKCKVDEILQRMKDAIREDLKTIGNYHE